MRLATKFPRFHCLSGDGKDCELAPGIRHFFFSSSRSVIVQSVEARVHFRHFRTRELLTFISGWHTEQILITRLMGALSLGSFLNVYIVGE